MMLSKNELSSPVKIHSHSCLTEKNPAISYLQERDLVHIKKRKFTSEKIVNDE